MSKFRMGGVALVAMFAFLAITVSSAIAEETLTFLLALWLVSGVAVPNEGTAVESTREILITDITNGTDVLCSFIWDGLALPESDLLVEKVLTLTGGAVGELTGTGINCTADKTCEGADAELWPTKLPWLIEAELMEPGGLYYELELTPEYHIRCLVLGLAAEETCTESEGAEDELVNVTGGVEAKGVLEPKGNCGSGKENLEIEEEPGNLIDSAEGPITTSST